MTARQIYTILPPSFVWIETHWRMAGNDQMEDFFISYNSDESACIGFGKDGFYFDQPSTYKICAVYNTHDGSAVMSNLLSVRVLSPLNAVDDDVADLFLGEDQGKLPYLFGSDSEFLKSGNDAFELVLDKHPKHPLAVHSRMVKGINASREFKTLTLERKFVARKAHHEESVNLLSVVVDNTEAGVGVDNTTLNMTMRRLAQTQKSAGDDKGAQATMKRMVVIFRKKSLKPHVMRHIEAQAKETLGR